MAIQDLAYILRFDTVLTCVCYCFSHTLKDYVTVCKHILWGKSHRLRCVVLLSRIVSFKYVLWCKTPQT